MVCLFNERCSVEGDLSVCELNTAHVSILPNHLSCVCLNRLSCRVKTTLLFRNASNQYSGDEADLRSFKRMLFIFFF